MNRQRDRAAAKDGEKAPLALEPLASLTAQLEVRRHLATEHAQRLQLRHIELTRRPIEHTQRAMRRAIGGEQRRPGVGAGLRLAEDQRIVGKARIARRIADAEDVTLLKGVRAERPVTRQLAQGEADRRHQPLTPLVDERHERHRRRADVRRQRRQLVERGIRWGVDRVQRARAVATMLVIGRNGRDHRFGSARSMSMQETR